MPSKEDPVAVLFFWLPLSVAIVIAVFSAVALGIAALVDFINRHYL